MIETGEKSISEVSHDFMAAQLFADNLGEQLSMAGSLQRDFLPTKFPNPEKLRFDAIFEPAEWVSGDIYDVARIDENHVGFYIADVVGHGVAAAFLTIFIKQALVMRETTGTSYKIFSPAEVMANLNQRLVEQELTAGQFATGCYCILNTETLELTYSRAGHPYPILFRKDQTPRTLEGKGPLLGIFEDAQYYDQTVQLEAGDKLLLYTDGIEPFIGNSDSLTESEFVGEFFESKDQPISEMIAKLNEIINDHEIRTVEVDDVTALGVEIL